jgi:hypothetical protein
MRTIIASLLAASLLAGLPGLAGTADAAPKKKKQVSAKPQGQARSTRRALSEFSRPEELPSGSNEWWRAMDREGRGGHNRP